MAIKVFIDTNIYESSNFSFHNKQFSKLKELVEEESVELLYNEIVYQEVHQHIEKNLTEVISMYNQVIEENRAFAPFRADEKWKTKISQINAVEMISDLHNYWDTYISDTHATKIPIDGVDVEEIVDKYFKKILPFENKKPTEFKDAICIDSIVKYYDTIEDDIIYVVAADKGFRKSFREREQFVTCSDLNKFLNIAISHTDHLAVEIERAFKDGELNGYISKLLNDQLYMGAIDVEDIYDDVELQSVETQSIKYGYIHELDEDCGVVIANATINIEVEYTVRDEDNSYYDMEDDCYYFENFITYRAVYCIDLEIEVSIVFETDEKELSVKVEVDGVNADSNLYLHERDNIECEVIHNTIDDYEDEDAFYESSSYCPDCGEKMTYENNMGAFCAKCAWKH